MHHTLKASIDTTMKGIIDPSAAPICTLESGDTITFDTWTMWENACQPDLDLQAALQIRERCRSEGRGPHTLTGPIAVKEARPGSVLRVDIERLVVTDHGITIVLPGGQSRGLLAADFPQAELRHFTLDPHLMTARFSDSVIIPLRPFLGIMGVFPSGSSPVISSIPGNFGGNIDCPDLVAGTTLYLPVFAEGAGFYAGDAHAAQGCGEVSQMALETAMATADVRLSVLTGPPIQRPRAETPDHLITMGFDTDLRVAAQQAVADMIDLLVGTRDLSRADAYVLCSLQADLLVTQIVNGANGIHARLPKKIFEASDNRR